jgi:hypothetical protein
VRQTSTDCSFSKTASNVKQRPMIPRRPVNLLAASFGLRFQRIDPFADDLCITFLGHLVGFLFRRQTPPGGQPFPDPLATAAKGLKRNHRDSIAQSQHAGDEVERAPPITTMPSTLCRLAKPLAESIGVTHHSFSIATNDESESNSTPRAAAYTSARSPRRNRSSPPWSEYADREVPRR